jgi:4-amino-4-deoxy-L-arabinose transferase-like glycosyltransferase
MSPNQEKGILASIVLAAFVFRALFIGHESLWPDEALYLYISKNLAINPLALKDIHGTWFYQNPPLFLYLLSFLIRTDFVQPPVLAHVLIMAMDAGIVLISFFIAKRLFGAPVGLISAALLAVNPLHWWTSSRVLLDIPLTFVIYLALLALIMNRQAIFYSLSLVSLATKYPAAPLFFVPLIRKEWVKKYPWLWFLAYGGTLLVIIFVLPHFRDIESDHLRRFINIFNPPNIQQAWIETKYFLGLPIVFFFIVGLISALKKFDLSPLMTWLILFGTARVFLPWQAFRMSRYTLPLYPAVIIFAAYGGVVSFRFLKETLPGRTRILSLVFSIFLLYVLATSINKGYSVSSHMTKTFVGFEALQDFFAGELRSAVILTSSPRQVKYMVPDLNVYDLPGKASPDDAERLIESNNVKYVLLDRWSPHQPRWALEHFLPHNGYQPAFATEHVLILSVKDNNQQMKGIDFE